MEKQQFTTYENHVDYWQHDGMFVISVMMLMCCLTGRGGQNCAKWSMSLAMLQQRYDSLCLILVPWMHSVCVMLIYVKFDWLIDWLIDDWLIDRVKVLHPTRNRSFRCDVYVKNCYILLLQNSNISQVFCHSSEVCVLHAMLGSVIAWSYNNCQPSLRLRSSFIHHYWTSGQQVCCHIPLL